MRSKSNASRTATPAVSVPMMAKWLCQCWGISRNTSSIVDEKDLLQFIYNNENKFPYAWSAPDTVVLRNPVNLRALLWNLREKSSFVAYIGENISPSGELCLLVKDETLVGHKGLFLVYCLLDEQELYDATIKTLIKDWVNKPILPILLTGNLKFKDGNILSIVAMNLFSWVQA